jgi:hypothetical protein
MEEIQIPDELQIPQLPSDVTEQATILRQLASDGARAEVRFLLFAEKVEQAGQWMAAIGTGSFADYLKQYITEPRRYATGIMALHMVGVERAIRIGIFAVKAVIRAAEDPMVRDKIFDDLEQRAAREGRPVSESNARKIAEDYVREAGQKKTRPIVNEADRLRQELHAKDEIIKE